MTELICLGGSVICGVLIYFFGGEASRFFVTDTTGEVKQICDQLFHITAWFFPFWVQFLYTEIRFRDWETGLYPCWEAFRAGGESLTGEPFGTVYGFVGILPV